MYHLFSIHLFQYKHFCVLDWNIYTYYCVVTDVTFKTKKYSIFSNNYLKKLNVYKFK